MVRIVISGALGRMGKRITDLGKQDPQISVVGGLDLEARPEANIARDLNGIGAEYDCVIEFTTPAVTVEHVEALKGLNKPIVIGTTGLSSDQIGVIEGASKVMPIVFSPNMSVGVNVLFGLIEQSARILGKDYRISIKEAHHIHKKDRPSGTAKLMAEIARKYAGEAEIPIESIREDEVVGDHEMVIESDTDILKISHSAKTRDIFALGALRAAKFVAAKNNGLFSMTDVLGL